jgi:hypothetical protein
MTKMLLEVAAHALHPAEREAVLGDLSEAGESGWSGVFEVLGLVIRRQAEHCRDWQPWAAAFGLALPGSFAFDGYLSLDQPGISARGWRRNPRSPLTHNPSLPNRSISSRSLDRRFCGRLHFAADAWGERCAVRLSLSILLVTVPHRVFIEALASLVSSACPAGSSPRSAARPGEIGSSRRNRCGHHLSDGHVLDGQGTTDPARCAALALRVHGCDHAEQRNGMTCTGSRLVLVLAIASLGVVPSWCEPAKGQVVDRELHSQNFADNKIGTSPMRKLAIYLPPD